MAVSSPKRILAVYSSIIHTFSLLFISSCDKFLPLLIFTGTGFIPSTVSINVKSLAFVTPVILAYTIFPLLSLS